MASLHGHGIRERRKIINRQALQIALSAAVESHDDNGDAARGDWLTLFKSALSDGKAEIERRFVLDQDGKKCVAATCFLIDQVLRCLYDAVATHLYPAANPTEAERLTVVAVGGYGRGEMAPESDVDILFLHDVKPAGRVEQMVESMLYLLWDMGLKVGQSSRSIDECIRQSKSDWTICTALLESRYIWGDKPFYRDLQKRFAKDVVEGREEAFIDAKLSERDERHEKMGDSRYVLEPNIKDGKGGLRDLHTLYWCAKFVYRVRDISELTVNGILTKREYERFHKAQLFLWTLRCHLHFLTRRPEERLTFDVQPELAQRMLYTNHAGTSGVERFMKHYFLIAKDIGDLTRIFCAGFEAQQKRSTLHRLKKVFFRRDVEGFPVDGGRITVDNAKWFREAPIDMLRIFRAANQSGLDLHPDAMKHITRSLSKIDRKLQNDPEANRVFMDILCAEKDPDITLRQMNECGVLGRFVPDFGRVVAQMQYDMYHVYTTDEHTIRAIGILNRIERNILRDDHPVSCDIMQQVQSREVLYVAVLLHDIAKGRGGDHSELGADIAYKLCPRLGLSEAETETVAWLVLHHLAMSMTATKRDLEDPKTISDFIELVRSPERLRLLMVLTVADIRAVGPKVWNSWKATLLRELYWRAEEAMSGASASEGQRKRTELAKQRLAHRLRENGWNDDEVANHLALGQPGYFLSLDTETLLRHAGIVREAARRDSELSLDTRVEESKAITEVTVYCADHPGLFARLSGALALAGCSIVDAKIATLNNGMAMDTFLVQDSDGGAFSRSDRLAKMSVLIDRALKGRIVVQEELERRAVETMKRRTRVFTVPPRVLIDNKASNTHTVIEVNGRDRPGLLYRLTAKLTELRLQIATAKISTYGEQVVDVFYIKDVFGMKVDHRQRLDTIRDALLETLEVQPKAKPRAPVAEEAEAVRPAKVRKRAKAKLVSEKKSASKRAKARKSRRKDPQAAE